MQANLLALEIPLEINKALTEIEPQMAQANRDQMLKGQDAKGGRITYEGRSTYSARTAKKKGFSSPINLKDSGDFHKATYADVRGSIVNFDSRDKKSGLLKEKSGEDIFGLNEESLTEVRDIGAEVLIKNINFKLGLT